MMNKIDVRPITNEDVSGIFTLFNGRKSLDEIRWLYFHPCGEKGSAFVAYKGTELIGVIGYITALYFINGEGYRGKIPVSWKVNDEHKGLAGVRLLFNVLKGADFYMGIGGSEEMKTIFKQLSFQKIGEASFGLKVYRPFSYVKSNRKISLKRIIKPFLFYFRISTSKQSVAACIEVKIDQLDSNMHLGEGYAFENAISKEHIKWLAACPTADIKVLELTFSDKVIHALIYLKTFNGYVRAEIVHIPFLKKNEELESVVKGIESLLSKYHVVSVSIMETNQDKVAVLKKLGFSFSLYKRPIVLKNNKTLFDKLSNVPLHLTFAESDKGYRNI